MYVYLLFDRGPRRCQILQGSNNRNWKGKYQCICNAIKLQFYNFQQIFY